jgi:hypothetical protein
MLSVILLVQRYKMAGNLEELSFRMLVGSYTSVEDYIVDRGLINCKQLYDVVS